ncbi:MarR family transcriptional regulator [Nocardia sp. NPDC050710]|uniref:MarR family winged helix-turn-helix transcriptional regulator n=1 Tax=Nocardia sp. NPDC050710 TaxID=3157220 RepID=UPI0033CE9AFB
MTPSSQHLDLGILLGLAYQQFAHELRESLTQQGFAEGGRSDGYVLRSLDARPMNISELAERLEISKQGAAQIVDDMQRRELVERRPDPADGRAKLLYLTPLGARTLAAARDFHHRYERRLIQEHGAQALTGLRALLGAVATEELLVDPRFRPI